MTARMVMLIARAALLVAVLALCALATSPAQAVVSLIGPINAVEHVVVFYVLMLLAITAFPKGRRNDAFVALVVFGAMIEVVRESMGAPRDLSKVLVDAAGAMAVYAPTYLEVLRQNMRTYPAGPPFASHFVDRRGSPVRVAKSAAPKVTPV